MRPAGFAVTALHKVTAMDGNHSHADTPGSAKKVSWTNVFLLNNAVR